MKQNWNIGSFFILIFMGFVVIWAGVALAAAPASSDAGNFPRSLESYTDAEVGGIWAILKNRVKEEPFNLVATLIFFLAIVHTS